MVVLGLGLHLGGPGTDWRGGRRDVKMGLKANAR